MSVIARYLLIGWRFARRGLKLLGLLLAVYLLYLLVGLLPRNRDFVSAADGVAVYVVSSPVHTDLIVPIEHREWDWASWFPANHFAGDTSRATHMAIGWGDRGFYLETPTWADLKATTAVAAMFLPSKSVVHVWKIGDPAPSEHAAVVRLSDEQYRRLCEAISTALKLDETGEPILIEDSAYTNRDAFYRGRGSYHCFNTCNSWAGRRLADAGVTVPLFSPLPHQPAMYLPEPE